MSSTIPALPAHTTLPAAAPVKSAAKPPAAAPPGKTAEIRTADKKPAEMPHTAEHRAASALSASDIGYVKSLMGIAPAQAMASIMLKTGVPMPANLGQDVDTTA